MSARTRLTARDKKNKLLADLSDVRRQILAAAASLPAEKQDAAFLGVWSVKDLLSHLAGWDYANLEGVEAILQGKLPAFYASIDKDWKTFNSLLVLKYKKEALAEMISCVEDSHRQLISFLEGVPVEEFIKDRGVRYKGYRVIVARILQSELDDECVHLKQIMAFTRGIPD